jgi:hypothetical protein
MGFDDSLYGLVLNDWHRPGQTVAVNPTNRSSDYGLGSQPDGYDALFSGATSSLKGSVMLAVGDTAIIIGGHMGGLFSGVRTGEEPGQRLLTILRGAGRLFKERGLLELVFTLRAINFLPTGITSILPGL